MKAKGASRRMDHPPTLTKPRKEGALPAPVEAPVSVIAPVTPRTGEQVPSPPTVRGPNPERASRVRVPPSMDERIADRYAALCEASTAAGKPAEHCGGVQCMRGTFTMCLCQCASCQRAIACLLRAQDENTTRGATEKKR